MLDMGCLDDTRVISGSIEDALLVHQENTEPPHDTSVNKFGATRKA
jgi:hypothetical protein